MKKSFFFGLVLMALGSGAMAQAAKVVSAYNYLRDLDFEQARQSIDEAITDAKTGSQAKTWYYRGAIYEQLYIDTNLRKKYPDALPEAIKSYEKAMEIDPKNQWKDQIQQGLIDCGSYLYNEGV